VRLGGVPETLLWTLHQRATEAARPDAVLRDPVAVDLVARIDFPFAERFGTGGLGQWQALRARAFDGQVRRFLAASPGATVVALGEGLETGFWRVDDGTVRWLGVDLPEVVDLRRRLLPPSPRRRDVACSATDPAWMDEVDPARPVLITAQGLLMYLEPVEVHGLIAAAGARFPGAPFVFDAVPRWLAERTRRGEVVTREGYRPPPWRWSLDRAEERRLSERFERLRAVPPPRGRGVAHGALLPLVARVPPLRRLTLSVLAGRLVSPPSRLPPAGGSRGRRRRRRTR
jgi:O-methyltransferase involved in polyketide biosynthesis